MAGPFALALNRPGTLKEVLGVLAAGEMLVDKTSFVGKRIDAIPLAGRAVIGGSIGAFVAHKAGAPAMLGAVIGAAAAFGTAHLAYRVRTQLPWSNTAGGLIEDAIVLGLASLYAREAGRPTTFARRHT